jgi:heat shock protein HslJ
MTPRTALALLTLTGLTLAACGSDDTEATPEGEGGSPTAEELDGRSFVSTDVEGHDLVEGSEINISFLADAMAVNAGCNSMNGGFQIDEGVLTAGPFAATMMACDEPLMDQDTWLNDFLTSLPTIALDGPTLTLAGGDTTITLEELQPTELIDTTWTVTGVVSNQAVSTVPAGSNASITIAPDGSVAVNSGCNTGSGTVEVTDETLTFGPIATTRRACADEAVNQLEASVLGVLQGEVTYEIEGDNLSLRSGDGADEIGLELTAQT